MNRLRMRELPWLYIVFTRKNGRKSFDHNLDLYLLTTSLARPSPPAHQKPPTHQLQNRNRKNSTTPLLASPCPSDHPTVCPLSSAKQEKVVVHGKKKWLGSSNAVSSSNGGSRGGKEEKNEWWKQLPGSGAGVVGATGSKGSFTKRGR